MIYTLGESLLDIIIDTTGKSTAKPGGAMLNVAVSLARTGDKVTLISEIGDDLTGTFITQFLQRNRVNIQYLTTYKNEKSSLALAFLDSHKKPKYSFYKNYPKKRSLNIPKPFTEKDILLLGSLYALDQKISPYIFSAISHINGAGGLIIYDPNIRQNGNTPADKQKVEQYISKAHIIKGSDEDFKNIFHISENDSVAQYIRGINPKAILFITLGHQGAAVYFNGQKLQYPAATIKPVSTVGAGDGFSAGIIHALQKKEISSRDLPYITSDTVQFLLRSGIRFATRVCLSEENYIDNRV